MDKNNTKINNNIFFNNYPDVIAKRILQNGRHTIITNINQLEYLIDEALNTNNNKSLHLGIINMELILYMKKQITNLPNYSSELLMDANYDLILNQSEIRHIKSDKNRLLKEEISEYIKKATAIVTNFDEITYSKQKQEALRFKKRIDTYLYYVVIIVSNKKRTLTIKTIYMDKNDFETKKETYLHRLIIK